MEEKLSKCPLCGETLELDEDLEVGDTLYCTGCDEELKIVSLSPVQLEEATEPLEDYGDDINYDEQ
ncbi:MAG: lysine biosynthesis protein LysW [Candidatus Omnitrophota bacterium]